MARVLTDLHVALRLGRWLGPWTPDARVPAAVVRQTVAIPASAGRPALRAAAWLPSATPARGALFVVPGLHPLGPDDPRFSRFLAVLAASGVAAFSPFLPDFLALRLEPTLLTDVERAFEAFLAWPARPVAAAPPGVMSISFGSRLALHLAGTYAPERVGRVVLFGGYSDWRDAMAFALGPPALAAAPRDPLNTPAVFLNLLDGLDAPPAAIAAAAPAWHRYVAATWGRPAMRAPDAHRALAAAIAAELPEPAATLFLAGCNLHPTTEPLARAALDRLGDRTWLDPTAALAAVRAPLAIVHGADDDVIPVAHAHALHRIAPPATRPQLLLTGLYGHTAQAAAPLTRLPTLARELATMLAILRALTLAATP
jgi:pimeloyl-ACP methyl ester carboxylesterase